MDHGLRVDTLEWGMSLVTLAVGNGHVEVAEVMVRRGANLDAKGRDQSTTARELARSMFLNDPRSDKHRRILEICGGNPERVLAEFDANGPEPKIHAAHDGRAESLFTEPSRDSSPGAS